MAYTLGSIGSILNSIGSFIAIILAHFIYKNDKIKGHLGIFLDVDKSKIWEDGETEASMYRVAVAHSLGHFDLLEKEPVTRGVHEGLLVHLDGDAAVKEDASENVSSITL